MTFPPSGNGSPPVCSAHHSPGVEDEVEPLVCVGELALVDDQPDVGVAGLDESMISSKGTHGLDVAARRA